MRGLCIYVDGGKGHYVPAKAVHDELEKIGVECQFEEFFDYLDIEWIGKINKKFWRLMLKMPSLEQHISKHNDSDSNGMELAIRFAKKHCERVLESNLEEAPFDFIFATHPYASTILSEMLHDMKIDIPVFYFATDVFSAPVASICDKLDRFFISTEEGAEAVRKMGQPASSIEIVPFPLQESIAKTARKSKAEARRELGLDPDLFTVQLNLGGEGLGSLKVYEGIITSGVPLQVVVIGGIDRKMESHLNRIAEKKSESTKVFIRGFIKDVGTYLDASDILVGRAGINTIVEAMYVHRPFVITELVYTVIPSADYVEKYHVGWNCDGDPDKAIGVILDLASNPSKVNGIDECFSSIPIEYGADQLARIVMDLVQNQLN